MTLDDAIDELYGAELAAFVALRATLVRELRAQGDTEDAERLAKLRKPTVFAWTLNQLARRERRDVDLLLDAGHRLREAQAGVLRGADRTEFERARQIEKDALRRLEHAAAGLLAEKRGGASNSLLQQISSTLRTAAVSEEGRELLARGSFVAPLESEGFGALAGLAPDVSVERVVRRAESAADVKKKLREAKQRLRELERAAREAELRAATLSAQAQSAAREANAARAAAERAADEVARLDGSG
ncbi:MAG: hypothetical protein QOK22_2173 [Gaiellaceae bacterium]|nr:hypothetical protein [Gaiellaceae bacterium]